MEPIVELNAASIAPAVPGLCCPRCKQPLPPATTSAEIKCPACGLPAHLTARSFAYDYSALLRARDPRGYLLYRALCNNGFVSYHELADGSLSLPGRADAAEFGAFLDAQVGANAWVLDIGCGPLPVPGYLMAVRSRHARLVGLDVTATQFDGFHIQGCAEFLPLAGEQFDAVVFATSLDHVADLDLTLRETRRVLRPGGCCCIWMSERLSYWRQFLQAQGPGLGVARQLLVALPRQMAGNLRHGRRWLYGIRHWFKRDRYWEYPTGQVFYCPPGAIDPFHSGFESPAEVVAIARRHGFTVTTLNRSSHGIFLSLSTPSSGGSTEKLAPARP